jgi:hypothetical protein
MDFFIPSFLSFGGLTGPRPGAAMPRGRVTVRGFLTRPDNNKSPPYRQQLSCYICHFVRGAIGLV